MAAFKLHCQCAHFQTALWKAAGMSLPPDLNPLKYGWEKKWVKALTRFYSTRAVSCTR